jgi:hypothetical protein
MQKLPERTCEKTPEPLTMRESKLRESSSILTECT